MMPAHCSVCGMHAAQEPGPRRGDWVEFADYRPREGPSDAVMLSHPQGLVYFCADHLARALELTQLTAQEALAPWRAQAAVQGTAFSHIAAPRATVLQRVLRWPGPMAWLRSRLCSHRTST